jgi:hypothetical protein
MVPTWPVGILVEPRPLIHIDQPSRWLNLGKWNLPLPSDWSGASSQGGLGKAPDWTA